MRFLLLAISAAIAAVFIFLRVRLRPYSGCVVRVFKSQIIGMKAAYIAGIINRRYWESRERLPATYSCCFMLSPDSATPPHGRYYRWFASSGELYGLNNNELRAFELSSVDRAILRKIFRLY